MTTATLLILEAFLEDPQERRFGLEITRMTGVRSGSLYPILARLEGEGWLVSGWEDVERQGPGRRTRRYYSMTPLGIRLARVAVSERAAGAAARARLGLA